MLTKRGLFVAGAGIATITAGLYFGQANQNDKPDAEATAACFSKVAPLTNKDESVLAGAIFNNCLKEKGVAANFDNAITMACLDATPNKPQPANDELVLSSTQPQSQKATASFVNCMKANGIILSMK